MLTDDQLELLGIQVQILHDCIRSIIYFRKVQTLKEKPSAWTYIGNVLSGHIVQNWCKIFGTNSEETHWKKLANSEEVKQLILPFSKKIILTSSSFSECEWADYRKNMTTARNEFFSHFDMSSMVLNFPDLDPALNIAFSYHSWLSDLVNSHAKFALTNGELIQNNSPSTEWMIKQFNQEVSEICSG